jgi:hypothetical protein
MRALTAPWLALAFTVCFGACAQENQSDAPNQEAQQGQPQGQQPEPQTTDQRDPQSIQPQQIEQIRLRYGNNAKAASPTKEVENVKMAGVKGLRISGPHTHKNLSIYLVHRKRSAKPPGEYLTLAEALKQKKVVVHETGDVNTLAVENVSSSQIFIQAGDIVKGGKQDRILGYDLVLKPKSGKKPIAAFCVEQGRWQRRGGEAVGQFEGSYANVTLKDQKLAYRSAKAQGAVWRSVAKVQKDLGRNLNKSVQSEKSATSLQLSLEDKDVKAKIDGYVKALAGVVKDQDDVIGYAVAVNGKMSGADLYVSNQLFAKLWPVMLKGCALEAVAELDKDKKDKAPDEKAVLKLLAAPTKGKAKLTAVGEELEEVQRDYDGNVVHETRDKDQSGSWLRRSYTVK